MELAARLAHYATDLRYEQLPPETVHEVKRRWIDSIGCALGAWRSETAQIVRKVAEQVQSGYGATLIGTRHQASPDWAAFVNGLLIRYLDYNDTYLSREPAHPSDNLAAVMAAAEAEGAEGKEVIVATVLAYEIQCRLCDAASLRARGWDHVNYGLFSASAAASRLMGLSPEATRHALSIAGVSGLALRQTRVGELSMWKGCAFANASRHAVFASWLAQYGMTGPSDLFEGKMGFMKQVSGEFTLGALGGEQGQPFMINETYIKYFPVEYHAQSAVWAALALRDQLNGDLSKWRRWRSIPSRQATPSSAASRRNGRPEVARPLTTACRTSWASRWSMGMSTSTPLRSRATRTPRCCNLCAVSWCATTPRLMPTIRQVSQTVSRFACGMGVC
jgi:2-methylcitrate dehydratase